ncbi:DUF3572 family protein [Paracoccus sp. SCSIO 75233]|uniref:DUF3572 family protein n=1 Tax=Paracoccus sp. SCSIO 75233 TaxID=3017782 RepID=UPI0022F0C6D5|nr:DUF3572 family protein [Paracoccus sp. SCSIO 75233]WBU52003.1 DUF3572 family protein [Paracoccus sp. SCSIO 75233]
MVSLNRAHELADNLLLHILEDPELLSSLLGRSGLDPSELGTVVNGPGAHEFVLDFVAESDERVIACAEALGVSASEIGMAARLVSRRD